MLPGLWASEAWIFLSKVVYLHTVVMGRGAGLSSSIGISLQDDRCLSILLVFLYEGLREGELGRVHSTSYVTLDA